MLRSGYCAVWIIELPITVLLSHGVVSSGIINVSVFVPSLPGADTLVGNVDVALFGFFAVLVIINCCACGVIYFRSNMTVVEIRFLGSGWSAIAVVGLFCRQLAVIKPIFPSACFVHHPDFLRNCFFAVIRLNPGIRRILTFCNFIPVWTIINLVVLCKANGCYTYKKCKGYDFLHVCRFNVFIQT